MAKMEGPSVFHVIRANAEMENRRGCCPGRAANAAELPGQC